MTPREKVIRCMQVLSAVGASQLILQGGIPATVAARLHERPEVRREYGPLIDKHINAILDVVIEEHGIEQVEDVGYERLKGLFFEAFSLGAKLAIGDGITKKRRPWRK